MSTPVPCLVPPELRVGVDVGAHHHSVSAGLSDGGILDRFTIAHDKAGFATFFSRIERLARRHRVPVAVAMEGYNGHARPLDCLVRRHGWRLYNVNNLKLARFKEIFPAAAKSDRLDSDKALELFQLKDHLPMAKNVLQEVMPTPPENAVLKRLSRRRRRLVDERTRLLNALQSDLRATCPGLLSITGAADNLWFLTFLTCRKSLRSLARMRRASLLKLPAVGRTYADAIQAWQARAVFAADADLTGPMIQQDARRIRELTRQIKALERQIAPVAQRSGSATILRSLPGFGATVAAELAGEIGTIARFRKDASLAIYLGMAPLDDSSGNSTGAKPPRHVNARAKAAMMVAVDRHRKLVPQSQRYYERKRQEGKSHNQAIRALGRQLCKVIYQLLKHDRLYAAQT